MRVGAHVSVQGGLYKGFDWVDRFDCECLQVFTKSQLQWNAKPLEPEDISQWLDAWDERGWMDCLVHNSYLINLASPDEALRQKSVDAMVDELERASLLGIPWVCTHPGSFKDAGRERGLELCGQSLREVMERSETLGTGLLLENTAGMGNTLGAPFEELGTLIEYAGRHEQLGVCFDTCHGFSAGYDLRSATAYEDVWRKFEAAVGLERLKAFHLNDSRFPLGSRKDRHAGIGEGEIGPEGFRLLMNDARFDRCPGFTELADELTPGSLERLKGFREGGDAGKAEN